MYQQARRIGELNARGGPSYRDLATVQCQSYLAAANALSLVSREHAWVAIVADENVERVSLIYSPLHPMSSSQIDRRATNEGRSLTISPTTSTIPPLLDHSKCENLPTFEESTQSLSLVYNSRLNSPNSNEQVSLSL